MKLKGKHVIWSLALAVFSGILAYYTNLMVFIVLFWVGFAATALLTLAQLFLPYLLPHFSQKKILNLIIWTIISATLTTAEVNAIIQTRDIVAQNNWFWAILLNALFTIGVIFSSLKLYVIAKFTK